MRHILFEVTLLLALLMGFSFAFGYERGKIALQADEQYRRQHRADELLDANIEYICANKRVLKIVNER